MVSNFLELRFGLNWILVQFELKSTIVGLDLYNFNVSINNPTFDGIDFCPFHLIYLLFIYSYTIFDFFLKKNSRYLWSKKNLSFANLQFSTKSAWPTVIILMSYFLFDTTKVLFYLWYDLLFNIYTFNINSMWNKWNSDPLMDTVKLFSS